MMVLAIGIILIAMALVAPKTDGSGNALIWNIVLFGVAVPCIFFECVFLGVKPLERREKKRQSVKKEEGRI